MQPSIDNDAVPIPSSNDKMDDDVPTDPEGYNSEAKSVEGVDGQDSVRSSIHPPASLSKRSNQKGRGSCHQRRRAGGTCQTCLVKTLRIKPQVCLWSAAQRTRVETWTVGHVTTVLSPLDWEGLLMAVTPAPSVP